MTKFEHEEHSLKKERLYRDIEIARAKRAANHKKNALKGITSPDISNSIKIELKKARAVVYLSKGTSKKRLSKIKERY